jgi:hypothetical protein
MNSRQTYEQLFDQLLSQELSLLSGGVFLNEGIIQTAMKRVLGKCIRKGIISLYSRLFIDEGLNVHVTIKDPMGELVSLILYYGG